MINRSAGYRVVLGVVVLVAATLAVAVIDAAPQSAQPSSAADEYQKSMKPVPWLDGKVPNVHPIDQHLTDPALVGAIDMHSHLDPDISGGGQEPRAIDSIDAARMAQERKMRGFVYKTHMDTGSADSAYLTRKVVPGVEVFARYAMNLTSGGINPAAVTLFINKKGGWGRIIEAPTRDGAAPETENRPWVMPWAAMLPNYPKTVTTVRNGEVTPEMKVVITLLKGKSANGGKLVFATGHASTADHIILAKESLRQGVTTILTHPIDQVPLDRLVAIAKQGAWIEITASTPWIRGQEPEMWSAKHVPMMKQIGVDHMFIGSDMGQTDRPLPGDGLAMFAKMLRAHGFSEGDLDKLFKTNATKILGIPAQGAGN